MATVGANLNVGLADTRTEPTSAMAGHCQANPDTSYIPLAVAGHESIYLWECRGGQATIQRQALQVDPRGYVAEFWHRISPIGK